MVLVLLVTSGPSGHGPLQVRGASSATKGNEVDVSPIIRVLNMLRMMQEKVQKEVKTESALFEKAMCRYQDSDAKLKASIQADSQKILQLEPAIQESIATRTRLEQEIQSHKDELQIASEDLAQAKQIRENERKAFEDESTDRQANIVALGKAIQAFDGKSSGNVASFWQSDAAVIRLHGIVAAGHSLSGMHDQKVLLAFLEDAQHRSVADVGGDEVLGILQQMLENMQADSVAAADRESKAQSTFESMSVAKQTEVTMADKAIGDKTGRLSSVKVHLTDMKQDLENCKDTLGSNKELLEGLDQDWRKRRDDYEALQKDLAEEARALQETVKVLNDGNTGNVLRDSLPLPSAPGFLQVRSMSSGNAHRSARRVPSHPLVSQEKNALATRLKLLLSSIGLQATGKQVAKTGRQIALHQSQTSETSIPSLSVPKMTDGLITELRVEQGDDDRRKQTCEEDIFKNEDRQQAIQVEVEDLLADQANTKQQLQQIEQELSMLSKGLAELDQQVKDATEARKEENIAFVNVLASNHAASELLDLARQRLETYYGKQPGPGVTSDTMPKEEYSRTPAIILNLLAEIQSELKKEFNQAQVIESDAQQAYEKFLATSTKKRQTDAQAVVDKSSAEAYSKATLSKLDGKIAMLQQQLQNVSAILSSLHESCDFLLAHYVTRKNMRSRDISRIQDAKALLTAAQG